MAGPLSHVRVLDLSRIMAGPWAGQILADLGADVIKVERPVVGDDTRAWGPPFLKDKSGNPTREAGYYLSVNRGKRSIALDLDKPEGQNVVRAIAARSDIVLENFKAGTLKRFGLDYESLRAVNPRLIYCSITGFGQTGPKRDAPAYDFMIQAMGALMSVTGEADDKPGGGPQKVGVPITDIMTGMYAAVAVLAALAKREVSGRGDYIDISMLDVQVAYLANQAMNFLVSGKPPRRSGNAHPNIQPQDVFACRDGYLALAVGNDSQFEKFCVAVGHPEWAQELRFRTNAERVRNRETLKSMIADILAQGELRAWVARIEAAGVPSAAINTVPMALEEPQVKHRKMLRHLPHSLSGTVPQIVSPMTLPGLRAGVRAGSAASGRAFGGNSPGTGSGNDRTSAHRRVICRRATCPAYRYPLPTR
jgi:crotonobetainyl-CoA:carnitine CoA-transferase CaiB-like acyl-CoA transferase